MAVGPRVLQRVVGFLASRAILLLLVAGFLAVALVGVVGMSASVMVAVSVQGSGSAINVAGSLRRLTHRVSALVVADALDGGNGGESIDAAIEQLETRMAHPALLEVLKQDEAGAADAIYRGVISKWHAWLKPELLALVERPAASKASVEDYRQVLADVDEFVEQLNTLVAVLEHDAEARIAQLRTILAVALFVVAMVVIAALARMRRRVFLPLADLRGVAGRISRRDFSARSAYTGPDELGVVAQSFNTMASELSAAYGELEHRVARKTADLQRSNQSLELLYHVITRLYHAPASADSYAETLADIERTLGLKGSFACVQSKHGGAAAVLFSSLQSCDAHCDSAVSACEACPGRSEPWTYRCVGDREELLVPLRDAENLYGILRLALPRGHRLEAWQTTLLEAVSRHMGVALGITRQSERERLLALQEERSAIARELHDSLAQSLSYMKIQVSLLSPMLGDAERGSEAAAIVADLREGINSAYRQLRELLSSFRLHMDGDFVQVMQATADEFAGRSGLPVDLDLRLGSCSLTPNQEVHLLHIVREALSNATRHAEASRIWVTLEADDAGLVSLEVCDNGKGVDESPAAERHHYGLNIMAERANRLHGGFDIGPREGGGTRLTVRFTAHAASMPDVRVVNFTP